MILTHSNIHPCKKILNPFFTTGLDEVMTDPNQFNWAVTDKTLQDAIGRQKHVIWRFFVHYPGQSLRIPQYLLDGGLSLYDTTSGKSPSYDDPMLLTAFQQFISALGKRYDGAKGLGFIQMGLLGFWGEWHTYPDTGLLSEASKNKVVQWFADAFSITPLQTRYPLASAYAAKMGYHDDSFAHSTLDGAANAGKVQSWFFWPSVIQKGQTDFWKYAPMGGETRPEIQGEVFEESYPAGTVENKQDFMLCVETTHATYMFHHNAFKSSSPYSGKELENARRAHASMGYNFQITRVAVASGSVAGTATVDVTVQQVGVAPFYYPLSLALKCQGAEKVLDGVESLISRGDSRVFSFTGIPANSLCFDSVSFQLRSEYVHAGRPVLFAQGNGVVSLSLPLPPPLTTAPITRTLSPLPPTGPISPTGPAPSPPSLPTPFTTAPIPRTQSPLAPMGPISPTGPSPSSPSLPIAPISPTQSPQPPTGPTSPTAPAPSPSIGSPRPPMTLSCFSSQNWVNVLGKGLVSMDQLRIGDYVLGRDNTYSRVYSFGHIHPDTKVEFLQIYVMGLPDPLELSARHMVFVEEDRAIRADAVQVGDTIGQHQQRVVYMVKTQTRRGVYAPFTESGDIVVNGILASSYVEVFSSGSLRMDQQHQAAHAFLAIRRIWCRWNFEYCLQESHTDEGLATWLAPLAAIVDRLDGYDDEHNQYHHHYAIWRFVFISIGLIYATIVYLLEQILLSTAYQQRLLVLSLVLYKCRMKQGLFRRSFACARPSKDPHSQFRAL
jgi:hypothetical protein